MPRRLRSSHIIFDLDGTLWDPTEVSMEAWRRACVLHGVDPKVLVRSNFASAYGHPAYEVATVVLPHVDPRLRQLVLDTANDYENQLIPRRLGKLFEGVPEVLSRLARTKCLYLCSNCQSGYIEAFTGTYGLEGLFAGSICASDTGLDKVANLRALLERHALADAVMVGDMESDREAARLNGIPFIHAGYGFGTSTTEEISIASLAELETWLA